jgi:hypothetical protein
MVGGRVEGLVISNQWQVIRGLRVAIALDNESEEERFVSQLDTGRPKSDTVAIPDLHQTNTGAVPCVQDSREKVGIAGLGGKQFGLTPGMGKKKEEVTG